MTDDKDAPDILLGLKKQEIVGSPIFATRPVVNRAVKNEADQKATEEAAKAQLGEGLTTLKHVMFSRMNRAWDSDVVRLWRPFLDDAFSAVAAGERKRILFPQFPEGHGKYKGLQPFGAEAGALIGVFDIALADIDDDDGISEDPRWRELCRRSAHGRKHDIIHTAADVATQDIATRLRDGHRSYLSGKQLRREIDRDIWEPKMSPHTDPLTEWNYLETAIYVCYGAALSRGIRFSELPEIWELKSIYHDLKYRRVIVGAIYDLVVRALPHHGCDQHSPYVDSNYEKHKTAFVPNRHYKPQVP